MPRLWTTVRPVDEPDWPAVLELCRAASSEMPMGADTLSRHLTLDRLRTTLTTPGVTTLLAVHDDVPVGLLVLTASPLTALTNDASMSVEVLYVLPEHRTRGVAAQLLGRAAATAESLGATHLASTAPASSKTANRFYARLGFNAAVTRRVVSTVGLRRRLTADASPADRLLARRLSVRARTAQARRRSADAFTLQDATTRHAV